MRLMKPKISPAARTNARPTNSVHDPPSVTASSSDSSTGCTPWTSTSHRRKMRMPAARELSAARSWALAVWTRPSGRPRKIVKPAIAPRTRICAALIESEGFLSRRCKGHLTGASATITEPSMAHRHSVDEYLETIYFLAFPIGEYAPPSAKNPALAARVAEMLGVSRASAGEMLKRLERGGLVRRGEHKEALLTKKGRSRAERVVRKHRIIERLLTDFMGYTAAEAHVYSDELGDTFTDDMIERVAERLGHPERCPHGWPVEPAVEQAENDELVALAELGEGSRATIVRLAEHDGDLLHWFYDNGLEPGTAIHVTGAKAGAFRVKLDGREQPVAEKAALGLFVRPA